MFGSMPLPLKVLCYLWSVVFDEVRESGLKVKLILLFTIFPTYLHIATRINEWQGHPVIPILSDWYWMPCSAIILTAFVVYSMAKKSYLIEESIKPKIKLLVGKEYPLVEKPKPKGALGVLHSKMRIGVENITLGETYVTVNLAAVVMPDGEEEFVNVPLSDQQMGQQPYVRGGGKAYFDLGYFQSDADGSNPFVFLPYKSLRITNAVTLILQVNASGPGTEEKFRVKLGIDDKNKLVFKEVK